MTIRLTEFSRSRLFAFAVVAGFAALSAPYAAAAQVSVDFTVHESLPVTGGKMIKSNLAGCMAATVKTTGESNIDGNGVTTFVGSKRINCGSGNTLTLSFSAKSSACRKTDVGIWKVTKATGIFAAAVGQGKLVGTYTLGKGPGTFCSYDGIDDRYTGKITF